MVKKNIVLTGGPCAGKTQVMEALKEHFKTYNDKYRCFFVSETATQVIEAGMHPTSMDISLFQQIILEHQLQNESFIQHCTSFIQDDRDFVIFYDRGALDGMAYLPNNEEFQKLLSNSSRSEIELLDQYDLVIDLITTAAKKPEFYECESNKTRTETVDDAIIIDQKTSNAWVGHRNMLLIPTTDRLEEKIAKVIDEVESFLCQSQTKYITRFLLNNVESDFDNMPREDYRAIEIEEHYLNCDSEWDHILSKRTYNGISSYLFKKQLEKHGELTIKEDQSIDLSTYQDLMSKYGVKKKIEKKRISFVENYEIHHVDFYPNSAILEKVSNSKNFFINPSQILQIYDRIPSREVFEQRITQKEKTGFVKQKKL